MSVFDEAMRELVRNAVRSEIRELPEQLKALVSELQKSGSTSDLPVYLTAEEVADLAKVRPQTVRSWVNNKVLPGHYAGRKLRIRLDELQDFMQRERSTDEPTAGDDEKRVRELVALSR